jgi:hypothetical protein
MQGLLLFVLPEGRSAEVTRPNAQSICDRLWEQGIEPGAATAATRIAESLHTHASFQGELQFDKRELAPLLDAAEIHPRTWADLLHASNLAAMTSSQRRRLLATCEDLITNLAGLSEHGKVSALIDDLEHLRTQLSAIYS